MTAAPDTADAAPISDQRASVRGNRLVPPRAEYDQRTVLAVERIGYLVPRVDFDGSVHSVFARACNIACDPWLLTVVAPGLGDGPTTLLLGGHACADLRLLFRPGDRVSRLRDAVLSGPHPAGLQTALDGVFAIGATSGADLVTGLLAGFSASWLGPRTRR